MARVTEDTDSIDWLLVESKPDDGSTEYITRKNTTGGLAPEVSAPEMAEILVPYMAVYCFYSRDSEEE